MKSQKQFGKTILLIGLICLLLCGTILFSGCSRLALFMLDGLVDETTEKSESDSSPLHVENAEDILKRSNSEASLYGSAGTDVFSVSEVVRLVQDSVVEIYTATGSYGSGSAGSGVIISETGYVLTCHHVVEGANAVVVKLKNEKEYNAQLVGTDSNTDLAVLKINPAEGETLVAAMHGISGNLVAGETVVAIGNPLGSLGGTVTHGIISATARQVSFSNNDGSKKVMTLLQTDAAINSGNSGGGLFNLKGELIGIVNAKYASTGVEGLGFAIPIDSAYTVEQDLIEYGYVRGIVDHGLTFVDITAYNVAHYSYYYGLTETGLYVVSSKYNDELTNKDRIVSVNGISVNTIEEFEAAIKDLSIGDNLNIQYVHYIFNNRGIITSSETKNTSITLREYVPDSVHVDFN